MSEIKYNTYEEAIKAVRRDGYNLGYVREDLQTYEMCMRSEEHTSELQSH